MPKNTSKLANNKNYFQLHKNSIGYYVSPVVTHNAVQMLT